MISAPLRTERATLPANAGSLPLKGAISLCYEWKWVSYRKVRWSSCCLLFFFVHLVLLCHAFMLAFQVLLPPNSESLSSVSTPLSPTPLKHVEMYRPYPTISSPLSCQHRSSQQQQQQQQHPLHMALRRTRHRLVQQRPAPDISSTIPSFSPS